jgi:hypothetical protein
MTANHARLTHKITIQLHLVVESCTICCSRSWRPVRKLLDTPSDDICKSRHCEGEARGHRLNYFGDGKPTKKICAKSCDRWTLGTRRHDYSRTIVPKFQWRRQWVHFRWSLFNFHFVMTTNTDMLHVFRCNCLTLCQHRTRAVLLTSLERPHIVRLCRRNYWT